MTTVAVFLLWWLQGVAIEPWLKGQGYSLFWYDTDWVAASLALVAVLLVWGARRSLDQATSLVLHLALGWWAGFLLLVLVLGLHMTPPRGDNWSGCLGMTAGLLWYCRRTGMLELARATLALRLHRRNRLRRRIDAQAGRDYQRIQDQLAQYP